MNLTQRKVRMLILEIYRTGPVSMTRARKLLQIWMTISPDDFVGALERAGFTVNSKGKIVIDLD